MRGREREPKSRLCDESHYAHLDMIAGVMMQNNKENFAVLNKPSSHTPQSRASLKGGWVVRGDIHVCPPSHPPA